MQLIAEKRSAREKYDNLRFVRADGSETQCDMPRQGILPHDLVHFVVESHLPFSRGFLSLVAAGGEARFVMDLTHDFNNPTVHRESSQVEAIVEALQSQLWTGVMDVSMFELGVASACAIRHQPNFHFADSAMPQQLFDAAVQLNETWQAVSAYHALTLNFPP